MDVDSRIVNPILNDRTELLSQQQLFNIGLNRQVSGGQLQNNQSFIPSQANVLTRSETANTFQNMINLDGRRQRSDYVSGMDSRLFQSSTFKECMNQEMISSQLQNLMQQQDRNYGFGFRRASSFHESSPICHKRKGMEVSPGFYDPNLSYSGSDYLMATNTGCDTLGRGNGYNSHNFGQYLNNDQEGSMLFAFNGSNMPPLVDLQQTSEEVFSQKKVSSVIACSGADLYSYKEPSEVGEAFPIRDFSYPESGNGLFQNGLQMVQSNQCNQQPCPPHFEYNKVSRDGSSKLPQLFSKQFHGFQASKPPGSVLSLHNILFSYLNYKSKLVGASRSQPDFLEHLHLTVCNGQRCECEKYLILTSHFDNCYRTDCKICGPVRQFYIKQINSRPDCNLPPAKKITSAPEREFSNLHPGGYIFGDTQATPKRTKMDNAVQSDDWSLSAIVFSALSPYEPGQGAMVGEEISLKMNKELLSSQESPRTCVTGNGAVDNGGSESVNASLGKIGPICNSRGSASVDKEMLSSIENTCESLMTANDASDTKKLCNDYDSFNSEEPIMADKQQEMACVNTSKVNTFSCQDMNSAGTSVLPGEPYIDQEDEIKPMSEAEKGRVDVNCDSANCKDDYPSRIKLEDSKGFGVSLTDFFNAEQIKGHLHSLNQCIDLSVGKESTGKTSSQSVDENTCQLCAMDRLVLTAPPLFCTSCGTRIKDRLIYYSTLDEMGAQHCFCTLCFKESRGGNISFRGLSFSKAKLTKEKNIKKIDEAWVRCDKCERWQHQICALYNPNRDFGGKEDYFCPFCRLAEISAGQHVSTPPAFGAKDLPRTMLSDHIERRLFRSLERERNQRAELLGKSIEEVPGAEDLMVRVVLAVKKQLKVKQQFLDILHGETYPTEFPYKSKVIMLFQKVDGIDVCLFAMYVQEFGSECGHPNQRSVYISYLDSVKYFRPDIKTVAGEALRTFVYHEILIGYLEYCKQRGFTTCYIWACPPLKGDDYILYCHPETQKTPKPDKLRQWYKLMLKKALEEDVVVEYTNFYDYFFVPNGECNNKITAARLPYFDGDYWSGAIEDMIRIIGKESGGESEGKVKKLMTKRTLRAMGHSDLSVDATKDILVMQKLGHSILPVKEDFIVVHLQYTCINCREAILSGDHWSCNECSNFHLCSRCFEVKRTPGELKTHTNIRGETHVLCQVPVNVVAADTEDKDVILDNDFFENRHSFLDFCQKNNYQFDTLRRAKYSSMMIMHHLRKMTALTMGNICNICHEDITVEWQCEICSQFHVCNACYQKVGDACHVHKLSQHLSNVDCKTKSKKLQQQRTVEVKGVLDLLSHASHCQTTRDKPCSYPKCLHIKKLFLHNRVCKSRVAGGCDSCKKIWSLLCLHSRNCEDSNCKFPRCMDIKNHKEKLAAQSDAQERAAVTMQLNEVV